MKSYYLVCLAWLLSACAPVAQDQPTDQRTPEQVSLDMALSTGDVQYIGNERILLTAIEQEISQRRQQFDGVMQALAADVGPMTWYPTHDAALLTGKFGEHQAVLTTNYNFGAREPGGARTLALAGSEPGRFIAMGSNPMRTMSGGAQHSDSLNQWLDNALEWLLGEPLVNQRIVLAQLSQSHYFPDLSSTQDWFEAGYPQAQLAVDCSDAKLADCLAQPTDLLVISQHGGHDVQWIRQQVANAMAAGVPVLYMHHDGGLSALGRALFEVFDIEYQQDNYWSRLGLNNVTLPSVGELPASWQSTQRLLADLATDQFSYDIACQGSSTAECADFSSNFDRDFQQAASFLRNQLTQADARGEQVMQEDRLLALLVLLGDFYRAQIRYPLSDQLSVSPHPTNTFIEAYLADHLVFNRRSFAPVPRDLGNFSRTDFSHVTPTTITRDYQSKRWMRAAGVYVLPGQTVTVTRLDQSATGVKLQVNSLRHSATKEWGAYKRAKYLTSAQMPIAAGERISFTSVYGGPLQLIFEENGVPVRLRYEQVGEHPFWRSAQDNERFTQQMSQGDYDWAEISTPGFEVHSRYENMRQTIAPYGNASELAALVERYTSSLTHALAGFRGPGVAEVPEIVDFAEQKGWPLAYIDVVKHMNSDQPTCGWGCSGNPYDAGWAFSPLGHGDLHELGHGLERGFFRFPGWAGHSTTNFYSYYAKAQYYADTGGDPQCQALPFASMFATIKAAQAEPDPVAAMQTTPFNGWSQAAGMHIQWFMAAQNAGVVSNGFHVLGRLHSYERMLWWADDNSTRWQAHRDGLGYPNLSIDQQQAMSSTDRLIIATSVVTERDMRAFYEPYGYVVGAVAAQALDALALPSMPVQFFAMAQGSDYCRTLVQTPIGYSDEWPTF